MLLKPTKKFFIILFVAFIFTFAVYFVYIERFGLHWNQSNSKNTISENETIIKNTNSPPINAPSSPLNPLNPLKPLKPSNSPIPPIPPITLINQNSNNNDNDFNQEPDYDEKTLNKDNTSDDKEENNDSSENKNPQNNDEHASNQIHENSNETIETNDKETDSKPNDASTHPSNEEESENNESNGEQATESKKEENQAQEDIKENNYYTSSKQETEKQNPDVESKRDAIRNAFKHAWNGYRSKAWGHDDLKPISGTSSDWVPGGIGMTVIDGITTAWIMGLEEEYNQAKEFIINNLSFNRDRLISVFETTIRALGGLVSAYDLTGEKGFLDKAIDLGDRLLKAFQSKTGVPYAQVNLKTGSKANCWAPGGTVLSEWSTLQLEFRRLSLVSGDPKYDRAVTKIMEVFDRHNREDGLYPVFYSNEADKFTTGHISFGAWGDSFYEYLLKQYLLTDKTENKYLELYKKSMNGMFKHLVKRSSPSNLLYIEEKGGSKPHKMDHLVCFAAGMLLLGSDLTGNKERDYNSGLELVNTCYETYRRMKSGLGPETVIFKNNDFYPDEKKYLLRPETVESIFYAWRFTHDEKYREWGWKIFQSIERHTKTQYGYASVNSVDEESPKRYDEMHSFFLAETLKYLYLLFSPDNLIPLDKFVFNTEAHPLKIENISNNQ